MSRISAFKTSVLVLALLSPAAGLLCGGDLELSGMAIPWEATVPAAVSNHAGALSRLYLPMYRLSRDPQRKIATFYHYGSALSAPWTGLIKDLRSRGVKVIGIAKNERMPSDPEYRLDEVKVLFGDPKLGLSLAGELLAAAHEDGLDGVAIDFQGRPQGGMTAFAVWFKTLAQIAQVKGMEVDIQLAPKSDLMPNDEYAGFQSYESLAIPAARAIFAIPDVKVGPGGMSGLNAATLKEGLSYGLAHLPLDRAVVAVEAGGISFKDGKAYLFGPGNWTKLVKKGSKPERAVDGRVHVEFEGADCVYADTVTLAGWLKIAKNAGLRGVFLGDIRKVDPPFWYWLEKNGEVKSSPTQVSPNAGN